MQINSDLFQSKLAFRIFGMFVLCALVPIVVLTLFSFSHVRDQLERQALLRLEKLAKAHALSIYEHLLFVESELKLVRASLSTPQSDENTGAPDHPAYRHSDSLKWVTLYRSGRFTRLWGSDLPPDLMQPPQLAEIPVKGSVLNTIHKGLREAEIRIVQPLSGDEAGDASLVGGIDSRFLWGLSKGTILPDGTDFFIFDHKGRQLFGSIPYRLEMEQLRPRGSERMSSGHAELNIGGKAVYAGYWSLFLKARFQQPSWTVIVLEPQEKVFAPITRFNSIFPLIIGMTILMVIFLCSYAIRKLLDPIESLMEGARQVAQNQFSHRVRIDSRDEFKDLAETFNTMSAQVEKQFERLKARSELDRLILSLLDNEKIVVEVLSRLNKFFPHRICGISILDTESSDNSLTYVRSAGKGETITHAMCRLSHTDRLRLDRNQGWLEIDTEGSLMDYLRPMQTDDVSRFIIFPVWVQDRLYALVSIGIRHDTVHGSDDLHQVRQLANQLASAFSNTLLIEKLKDLNMGTLFALARTVDAKCSWTSGHSVRVMRIARFVGRQMGLSPEALDDLSRSALLHDIGKIGIPLDILDKKGSLTQAEYDAVKAHPTIGVRILRPIKAYRSLLPIIGQHHERFDGKGYPYGIAGEEIDLSARILAVADTYDALVSDRPYRGCTPEDQAVELIGKEAGKQFDPSVVKAFLGVSKQQGFHFEDGSEDAFKVPWYEPEEGLDKELN